MSVKIMMKDAYSEDDAALAAENAVGNLMEAVDYTCDSFQRTFAVQMFGAMAALIVTQFGPRTARSMMLDLADKIQKEI